MSVTSAASNNPTQAAAVDQAVEVEPIVVAVVAKTGPDTALTRKEILLIKKKQLSKRSSIFINGVNSRKEDDIYVSTKFNKSNKSRRSDSFLLILSATTSRKNFYRK